MKGSLKSLLQEHFRPEWLELFITVVGLVFTSYKLDIVATLNQGYK